MESQILCPLAFLRKGGGGGDKKVLSIGTSLNNCLIVSTGKYLFVFTCEKSAHSNRM